MEKIGRDFTINEDIYYYYLVKGETGIQFDNVSVLFLNDGDAVREVGSFDGNSGGYRSVRQRRNQLQS